MSLEYKQTNETYIFGSNVNEKRNKVIRLWQWKIKEWYKYIFPIVILATQSLYDVSGDANIATPLDFPRAFHG